MCFDVQSMLLLCHHSRTSLSLPKHSIVITTDTFEKKQLTHCWKIPLESETSFPLMYFHIVLCELNYYEACIAIILSVSRKTGTGKVLVSLSVRMFSSIYHKFPMEKQEWKLSLSTLLLSWIANIISHERREKDWPEQYLRQKVHLFEVFLHLPVLMWPSHPARPEMCGFLGKQTPKLLPHSQIPHVSAAHFSIFQNRNLTVERILLKAAGHLRLYRLKACQGREEEDQGCWFESLQLWKAGSFIFVHNMKMVSTGTDRFLYLIRGADALDILWIFQFSCMKGKEMHVRWQRLFFCKIPSPCLSKY